MQGLTEFSGLVLKPYVPDKANFNSLERLKIAQDSENQWLWTYNNERPNMAIGGITHAQKLERHMYTRKRVGLTWLLRQ